MKKVLLLCSYKAPYAGNFVASLAALEEALGKEGFACVWAFDERAAERGWYRALEEQGRTLEPFCFGKGKYASLKRVVKKHGIDVIYTHFGAQSVTGVFALFNRGVKVLWHVHSDFSLGKRLPLKKRLLFFLHYRLMAPLVRVATVSSELHKKIPGASYIPNGLALSRPAPVRSAQQVRSLLGVESTCPLLLMLAWSPDVKGLDIAAQAVRELSRSRKVVLAVVAGSQMDESKLKVWLCERTQLSGDEEFLRFVEPVDNIFEYLDACDVFLSAARSEGFCSSVLEAAAAGKPCVLSDVPAVRSWAEELATARFFNSGDSQDCARAVGELLDNYPDSAELEESARFVRDKYSIENWCKSVLRFILDSVEQ